MTRSLPRLLDEPQLARVVPYLAPETLHRLIQHSGLSACGEIVASATPAQLAAVLDLDLWRSPQPGRDEGFDADRFGDWLELLADTGGTVAASTVAALDEDLVVAGLSRFVRVFDPAAFLPSASTDDEPLDREPTPHEGPECEVGGYLVRANRADTWDAIVALLMELDAEHPDRFRSLMHGVRRLSNSTPEIDGLDDLLLEPEQQLHDVAVDRDRRRSQQGYNTPADARAFLQMARQRRHAPPGRSPVYPIVAAYFRAADESEASDAQGARDFPRPNVNPMAASEGVSPVLSDVLDRLAEAGWVPQRPRALLEAGHPQASRLALIRRLMESVRDSDSTAYLARGRELAFLANTLVAGCSIQSRAFRPQEASDAAVSVCQLGLEHWPARWSKPDPPRDTPGAPTADINETLPDAFLIDHDLVTAFEVGWSVLHEDVSLFVAEQLLLALSDLQCGDAEIQEDLDALQKELTKQREASTPWHARDALDVIAALDVPAWTSLLGLLDECPVIPAAITAILERRSGAVSAASFEFICTRGQIELVREFMARLPGAL